MISRSFTHKGAVVTLHRRTNGDLIDAELIVGLLMDGIDPSQKKAWTRRYLHARNYAATLVSITRVEGEMGFTIPSVEASDDEIKAAFEAWVADESGFYSAWINAMAAVNAPPGDVDTSPQVSPNA